MKNQVDDSSGRAQCFRALFFKHIDQLNSDCKRNCAARGAGWTDPNKLVASRASVGEIAKLPSSTHAPWNSFDEPELRTRRTFLAVFPSHVFWYRVMLLMYMNIPRPERIRILPRLFAFCLALPFCALCTALMLCPGSGQYHGLGTLLVEVCVCRVDLTLSFMYSLYLFGLPLVATFPSHPTLE